MNPHDFLTLAQALAAGKGDAERRSAVSRAYYASFHVARRLIEHCGVTLPKGAASHDKVSYCLQNSRNNALAVAGGRLSTLRGNRNAADYQLSDQRFANSIFVDLQIQIATDIVSAIEIEEQGPREFTQHIREYAKNILALNVSSA